jgi:signal transduction histidine kinase
VPSADQVDHVAGAAFVKGGGEAGALMRSMDWTHSRLGPANQWPQSLRTAISICVGSRFPTALYWGPEFVMLYNDALRPMVGANKHPQALGRPASEVYPEVRDTLEPLLQQVRTSGEAIWAEDLMLPLFRHDVQQEGYFTFTYSPIYDESGDVGGVFCVAIETTDKVIEGRRLLLLNALANAKQGATPADACAEAAEHLAQSPQDVPFALLYLHDHVAREARLVGLANIDAENPLAPASIELGDSSIWSFDHETSAAAPRSVTLVGAPGGARGAVIIPIERAGGGMPFGFVVAGLSGLLRSTPSYERFHKLLGAGISQAVSNAAAYEEARERAESLAKLDRAKTTFFSNVSHEFRTPLTLMLAPIQDMLALPTGATIDRASVELLHRNALRLLKLVNTLLEFSRIEAGRVDAVYEPVELSAFTADLASSFRAVVESAGLAFVVDCPPLGEPIYVDREMWEKIVLNLLSNAFKFTFEGSITVRLRVDESSAILEVADTGTGIAESELPRLFERFHRIEGARSRSHEGSGIGLALIQELVRLHGGDVRVASRLGAGTTFEARIPRGTAHLAADRVASRRELPATRIASEIFVGETLRWAVPADRELHPARDQERIVFADDNADMREYVGRLLGEHWDVETYADGLAARDAIRNNPPALVLTDVMMPGLTGFELIRELRADPALKAIPIIVLSARAGDEETAKGLGSGANDYIAKPFSARELLLRVASNLDARRTADEMRERERVQRENLYRHFVQAPFPIAVLKGPEHVVELANSHILRAWGKGPDVVGLRLLDAIPELRGQPFIELLNTVYRTGTTYEGAAELARLPSGPRGELEDRYYTFVYAALRDTQGEIEGTLVTAFDVTAQVEANQASDRATSAQRAVTEFQERFVAILGHDLRNPIAAIDMALGLLNQRAIQSNDQVTLRILHRLTSSSTRMSRMVEQVLDLTRSRLGGGIQLRPTSIDLAEVLADMIEELRTAHPESSIVLRCEPTPGYWDRDRLEQVFSNLIGNAIHHGAKGQPITVDVQADHERVSIAVRNQGEPIAEAIRESLFTPFRRGERDSRSARAVGLGLGLYISHEIVVAHGGSISVQSSHDQGTVFCVTLPHTTGPR